MTSLLLVLCGPSGSGKSTLLKRLLLEYPSQFGFSISHTTRSPRAGEANGREYHFVTREDFLKSVEKGDFVEHAEFSGNCYGTSKAAIKTLAEKICILDIDVQGVKQIKQLKDSDFLARYVFIAPPSIGTLKERLVSRGTETEESLAKRLAAAESEMEYGNTAGNFDIVIVNDDVDAAYAKLRSFVQSYDLIGAKGDQ